MIWNTDFTDHTDFTDTIDSVFVFNLKGENKMLHTELTDKIISSFFKIYNHWSSVKEFDRVGMYYFPKDQ